MTPPSSETAPGESTAHEVYEQVVAELPLLSRTPERWARIAAADLPSFLADHAVCEQQAALFGLSLVGLYPEDAELVERMSALAAEEAVHLRRVAALLHRRGLHPARRRSNPWVQALREHVRSDREDELKVDRLLLGALIEARSCERFTRLHAEIVERDPEVARLLEDLGPAEARHWRMFHALARRELPEEALEARFAEWLEIERRVTDARGVEPLVHG